MRMVKMKPKPMDLETAMQKFFSQRSAARPRFVPFSLQKKEACAKGTQAICDLLQGTDPVRRGGVRRPAERRGGTLRALPRDRRTFKMTSEKMSG